MEIQFITDIEGKRTAAIIPFEEWERTEKAKDILEHVYLAGMLAPAKSAPLAPVRSNPLGGGGKPAYIPVGEAIGVSRRDFTAYPKSG